MKKFTKPIEKIDISKVDQPQFKKSFTSCIVLTKDRKFLLQQRPENWRTFPGFLAAFGGHIEFGETPEQTIIRELKEELGAEVKKKDLITLGAIAEAVTEYQELVFTYFWYDKNGTITGCYEATPAYFNTVEDILEHPKLMDDVRWMLKECEKRKLLQI